MQKDSPSSSVRRAMVTGASEGIGRVFARRLAEQGYALTLVARNEDRLRALVADLPGVGHAILVADLSKKEGTSAAVNALSGESIFTLLVNNAGFGQLGDFTEIPLTRYEEMMAVNLRALVALAHVFLSRAKKGDGLIQISSTLSFFPMPRQAVYAATKAFVTSFTESLWFQYRKVGVTVLNVCPGSTKTLFADRAGGMRVPVPEFVTETPEQVVDAALRAFERRKGPTLVCGWKNRFAVFTARFVSRKVIVEVMGKMRQ
ncbi:MAG: SDR family NAD(P)-dependent oxidoreductase [Cryobacterium sp.]|nr:SDR family NAD(P)-dependent oxidoreductase [Oligoflexia bacterium]